MRLEVVPEPENAVPSGLIGLHVAPLRVIGTVGSQQDAFIDILDCPVAT